MKLTGILLTDQEHDGERFALDAAQSYDVPITIGFEHLRTIGTAHVTQRDGNLEISGDIDGELVSEPVYAAPAGVIEAFEMIDGVKVITKFRIDQVGLVLQHADPRVPPIHTESDL